MRKVGKGKLLIYEIGIIFGIFCVILCVGRMLFFLKSIYIVKKMDFKSYMLLAIVIAFLAYGGMLQTMHFSVDSLNVWSNMGATWHLQLGRYTNFAMILMAEKMGINAITSQHIFMFLWILTMVMMNLMIMSGISECIAKINIKQKYLILSLLMISFVNVFSMELMLFPETAMWLCIGNLALGLSIRDAIDSEGSLKKWLISAIELFIALGCYQSYIGVYEIFVLMGFFLRYRNDIKLRYKQSVLALVVGGVLCLINVLIVRILVGFSVILDAGREGGLENIYQNIKVIVQYQISFWKDADGLFPMLIMPICLGVLVMVSIFIIKKQKTLEQKVYFVLMVCGGYILAFASHFLETTAFLTPRSNMAVWSVISVILIIGVYYEDKQKIWYLFGVNIFIIFFIVSTISTMNTMIANETATNAVDFSEARAVVNRIKEYENKTGNYITKMGTIQDNNCTIYSTESKWANFQLGFRIMATPHSNYLLVSYVLERKLENVEVPDNIYQEFFKDKDWLNMDVSEQVICADDTVYLCVY